MSAMVQRVANAMFRSSGKPFTEYAMNSELRKGYEVFARAAIEAMREPTEAMLEAGCRAHPEGDYNGGTMLIGIIEAEWSAMVDAALK